MGRNVNVQVVEIRRARGSVWWRTIQENAANPLKSPTQSTSEKAYVYSNFFSDFRLFFGKFWGIDY